MQNQETIDPTDDIVEEDETKQYSEKLRFKFDPIFQPSEIVHTCDLCGAEIEHEAVSSKWNAYSSLNYCLDCEDNEEAHKAELFESAQYNYIPEAPLTHAINKEYCVKPISKKTQDDYRKLLADIIADPERFQDDDTPIDWILERDLMKLKQPKKLDYIKPTQKDYSIDFEKVQFNIWLDNWKMILGDDIPSEQLKRNTPEENKRELEELRATHKRNAESLRLATEKRLLEKILH